MPFSTINCNQAKEKNLFFVEMSIQKIPKNTKPLKVNINKGYKFVKVPGNGIEPSLALLRTGF